MKAKPDANAASNTDVVKLLNKREDSGFDDKSQEFAMHSSNVR